jgi:hypothetical protein
VERQLVSRALLLFQSLHAGPFLLTCRKLYDVYDLKCNQYDLDSFTESDAIRFVDAFCEIYEVALDSHKMIRDLHRRGFADFISHPLMLTLVCILRTGPNSEIPRRAIGLIRRAIETLTFRWDEAKHVSRSSQLPLDGEERVRCLMRAAYRMKTLQSSDVEIEAIVREHLDLVQLSQVNPRKLIEELARWYGILVPVDNNHWQFVHRTIHDYLAARFWVESGIFSRSSISEWNIRAAYAVCLLPDATDKILKMIKESKTAEAFSECLYNRAPFDTNAVALAVIERASRSIGMVFEEAHEGLLVNGEFDFYGEASPEFLRILVGIGSATVDSVFGNIVACYALCELHRRGVKASHDLLGHRLAYLNHYRPQLNICIEGRLQFCLSDVMARHKD